MSQITLDVAGRDYGLEVVEYTVSEEITPLAPGDSSGGVGSIRVSAIARKDGPHTLRTSTLLDRDIVLTDAEDVEYSSYKGRGSIEGHINMNTETGGRVNLTAETILSRLNTDRAAAPVFGARKTGTRVTYLVNDITNPTLETGTTNYAAVAGTGGTAAFTRVNTAGLAFSGSYCGRVAWTVAATGTGGVTYTQAVTPGSTKMYSAHTRLGATKAAQTVRIAAQFLAAGSVPVGSPFVGDATMINNTTYTRLSVVGVAPESAVSVAISVHNYNSGLSSFTFSNWANGDVLLVDALMATQGTDLHDYFDGSSTSASWVGTANASASQKAVSTAIDEGFDATIANAVRYYCGLIGIPATSIIIDPEFEGVPVAYPAWDGNVWNHLKMLCVAVGAEMAVSGSSIAFRKPRKHTVLHENGDSFVTEVNGQATALAVEIYNYNNRWLVDSIVHTADNIISIQPGTSSVSQIKVPHSLVSVNNPNAVTKMSDPDTYVGSGQYLVTDANDVVVSPSAWAELGASVTTRLLPDTYDTIELTIIGPQIVGEYTAPFRIAQVGAFGDTPALYLTGEGVFMDKTITTIATAASITQTSVETAPTIDNPFISSAAQAADRGVLAAMLASGPYVSVHGTITYDAAASGSEFDLVVGGRMRFRDNIFRVKSATFTSQSVDIDAEADVLFSDLIETYSMTYAEFNTANPSATFTTYNALWAPSATFAELTASLPQPSFDDINALYAAMNFNDHALYPLIPEPTAIPVVSVALEVVVPTGGYGNSAYGSEPYGN